MVDLERLVAAAKAIRDQADIRFEIDGIKAIDAALLTELTEAVEDIEQSARHLGHGPAPLTKGERDAAAVKVAAVWDIDDGPGKLCYRSVDAVIDALPERFGVRRKGGG